MEVRGLRKKLFQVGNEPSNRLVLEEIPTITNGKSLSKKKYFFITNICPLDTFQEISNSGTRLLHKVYKRWTRLHNHIRKGA